MTPPRAVVEADPMTIKQFRDDIFAAFEGATVTYLRAPDGQVLRGEPGAEGVQPIIKEKE